MSGRRWRWEQWNPFSEKDRDHANLYRIHESQCEKAAKEQTAPEQPDVFPWLGANGGQSIRLLVSYDRDLGVQDGIEHNSLLFKIRLTELGRIEVAPVKNSPKTSSMFASSITLFDEKENHNV